MSSDRAKAAVRIQSGFRRHRTRQRIIIKTRALFHQIAEQLGDDPSQISWLPACRPAYPIWNSEDDYSVEKTFLLSSVSCTIPDDKDEFEYRNQISSSIEVTAMKSTANQLEQDAFNMSISDEGDEQSTDQPDSEMLDKLLNDLGWAQKAVIDRCLFLKSSQSHF